MSFKETMKKNKMIYKYYSLLNRLFYSCLTCISPVLNTKARYKRVFGRKLNLSNPQTLNEKILWLKLNRYMKDSLVIQCADKYRVREYVTMSGCGDLLNELYADYDSADKINWRELPNKFVLKWNFGAGFNIICTDKLTMDMNAVTKQMNKWGKQKPWLPYSEMQYKYAPKRIICERYLEKDPTEKSIPDYKVYCFHGSPLAILVIHGRGSKISAEFFNSSWDVLPPPSSKYEIVKSPTKKPKNLQQMLEASRRLSKPFPFVRCDFFIVEDKIYFGELTFTPAAGLFLSQTIIDNKDMTEYLDINKD